MINSYISIILFAVISVLLVFALIRSERYKKKLEDKVSGQLNVIWDLDDTGAPNSEPLVFAIFEEDPKSFKNGDPVTLIVNVKNTF